MRTRSQSKAARLASEPSLSNMPVELHMLVFEHVKDWRDRAKLCVAMPRSGLVAIDTVTAYKDPLLSVGMALMRQRASELIDEDLLRRYAADKYATAEGCKWLADVAAEDGLGLRIAVEVTGGTGGTTIWRLATGVQATGATLRIGVDGCWVHSAGIAGAERMVRVVNPNGDIMHFEGEKGAEHTVRTELPNGNIIHYEGMKGAEHTVRIEEPGGKRIYYEGEKGAEHTVRTELPNGNIMHYEGMKGAEHMVRIEGPDGKRSYYEGEKGDERLVRLEGLDGKRVFFEGESGDEHIVRIEGPDGTLIYMEGESGAERIVRTQAPDERLTYFYEGEPGAEHIVRRTVARYL